IKDALQNAAPSGQLTAQNTYDPVSGQLLTSADANGKGIVNEYDSNKRLAKTTDAQGTRTVLAYYTPGQSGGRPGDVYSVTVLDANQTVLQQTTYTYDIRGNRTSQTKSRTLPSGGQQQMVTTYIYDGEDRLNETRDPEYDPAFPTLHRTKTIYDAYGVI